MKHSSRYRRGIPFLLFVSLLSCIAVAVPAWSDNVPMPTVLFADTPIPPFVRGEMGEEPQGGFAVRLARKVLSELHVGTDMVLLPWNRVIKMAEHGRIDGITSILATPEREAFLLFTSPYYQSTSMIYYDRRRFSDFEWENTDDLLRYRIGIVRGYAFGGELTRGNHRIDPLIDWSDSSEMNFAKLLAGRVEIVIEDEAVASRIIAADPLLARDVGVAGKPFLLHRYRMAIAKASRFRYLIGPIDNVLERLRRSGELDSIISDELTVTIPARGGH